MLFTKTHFIKVRRATFGQPDAHGNKRLQLGEPEPLEVYAVAPNAQEEGTGRATGQGRTYAIKTGWVIYAPTGTRVGPHDTVILTDGTECQIIGEIANWEQTPFTNPTRTGGIHFTIEKRAG